MNIHRVSNILPHRAAVQQPKAHSSEAVDSPPPLSNKLPSPPSERRTAAFPRPVLFGARPAPRGLRNVDLNRTFLNTQGESHTVKDILNYLVRHHREFDNQAGPAGYFSGQTNAGRSYTSMYWWGLDKELGFKSSVALDPLVTYLTATGVVTDNSRDPNSPKFSLSKESFQTVRDYSMSAEAKEKIDKMQSRGGFGDLDGNKSQEYVEVLSSLPWGIESEDRHDLVRARSMFEEKFYGMESIKQKIMLKIAMRELKGKNRGGIILLVGAGGTGKTAIAETVAEALGRSYERISLAGVSDANDLLGFLYTYQGSKPGSIVEAMRKAGTMNPVIQIDEMDKVPKNATNNGNPRDALLAILDPDQNNKFADRYLSVPFDLSKVLFICTANSIQDFPEHLLSRTDVIQVPIYLEEEKLVIAQKHLIPRHLKSLNLPPNKIVFEDDAIKRVIRLHTREGGVRKLSARLMELLEHAGEDYLKQTPAQRSSTVAANVIRITPQKVDEWLSEPMAEAQPVQGTSKVGSVNGLYYSIVGGGVIPIKAQVLPGSGQLILTGNLGKVMQESARVALSYILANAQKLEVSQETVQKIANRAVDIHIQYLDSATEKDGPSAGASTFLTLYSAISGKPVPQNVGLTGEISLDGDVLPVGGMLEKISGAYYQGVKTIFLPKANEAMVKKEAQRSGAFRNILQKVNIQYVSNVTELLQGLNLLTAAPTPS